MTRSVHVNEYYDLFDVKVVEEEDEEEEVKDVVSSDIDIVPNDIKDTQMTNPFRGFSNWSNFKANNPNNVSVIKDQVKAPHANNSIHVDQNGDIWCYPPNVSVPYWTRIIFRNFDYTIKPANTPYTNLLSTKSAFKLDTNGLDFNIDGTLDDDQGDAVYTFGNAELESHDEVLLGEVMNFVDGNIFLRFDEYPSRSKVVFSKCDKTRNPDVSFNFNYHKSQMEPIKLNLSLSAGIPLVDFKTGDKYNQNLKLPLMKKLLKSCYWCIEWISDIDNGN